jgi:hypothetical protein
MGMRVVVAASALSFVLWSASAHAYTFVPAPGSPYAPIGPVEPSPGGYLGGMVAGDFNGDGISDLAVVNSTGVPPLSPGESVTVFLGSRTGGLVEAPGSPVAIFSGGNLSGAGAIAAADFNGDGHLDLAVLDEVHHKVAILLGDGTGRFQLAGVPIPYAGVGGATIVTGDFNGDGRQDIAVVNKYVTILLGNGSGGFTPAPGSPLALPSYGRSAAAGDFTGGGRSDLAVGETSGVVRVFLASPTGELQPAPGSPIVVGAPPSDMIAAALTRNGRLDLATANSSDDTVSVLLGNGAGGFAPASGSPFAVPDGNEDPHTPGLPQSIGVGDFACLGIPDLAAANFNGSSDNVAVLEGDGSGGFTNAPGSPFAANGNPDPLAVGDFNGDGTPDIAVANSFLGRITVLEDTASGGSCAPEPPTYHEPATPITPAPQTPSSAASPPQIEALSYTVRTTPARRAITLRFSLTSAATVVGQLKRVVRHRVHHRWHTRLTRVASFTIQGKAGANALTIALSRSLNLVPGRYEIVVFATLGAERSQVRTITLTVHR